jgi:hypothetical protein
MLYFIGYAYNSTTYRELKQSLYLKDPYIDIDKIPTKVILTIDEYSWFNYYKFTRNFAEDQIEE